MFGSGGEQKSDFVGEVKTIGVHDRKTKHADISFIAAYADCLDGLGTMGSGAHTPNETVNLETMNLLIQRTALLIYRLINE